MERLLLYSKQQEIKPISNNNANRYDQLALEVENSELLDLISIEMYQDLLNNPTTTDNANLLNGCSFTNGNGNTITHHGLRYVLAYLNYSRYIAESSIVDSYTGFVQQNRQESTHISDGLITRMQNANRKIALTAWETIREFLDLNYTQYPYWIYTDDKKVFTPKFGSVQRTKYVDGVSYKRCFTTGKRYE